MGKCSWTGGRPPSGTAGPAGELLDVTLPAPPAVLAPVPQAVPLTHIEALELGQVPEHLVVIGGGYVGVELSQAMRRFGSKVTVIDRNERLMSKEDRDVCEALRSLLLDEGIDVLLNARIKQVSGKGGKSVSVVVEQNGIEKVLKGSHLLVATGRNPNTESAWN